MPCIRYGGAIICIPNMRKFRYRNKYYYCEDQGISDANECGIFIEDLKVRKIKSKFYKELKKRVNNENQRRLKWIFQKKQYTDP